MPKINVLHFVVLDTESASFYSHQRQQFISTRE